MEVQKISDTIQKFDGVSYYRCGPYFQRKGKRLHRAVWEAHNGPVPDGYEVHHVNGNRADNNIENLQLLLESEHHSYHMKQPERIEQSRQNIGKAIEAARKWHSTEEGAEVHSRIAKDYWKNTEPLTYTCTYCGKEFQSLRRFGEQENRFCCNKHRTAWRYRQDIDKEERVCPVCGETYTTNKYSKQKYCSQECARRKRWAR